jgi:hypothetical protein
MYSLWENFQLGLRAILNTWVLTLPGGVLWLFAWYAGWHNSFNKGYEQAAVGPLTGMLGIVLFIAAMFFVPLAQARQAVTGEWRSFYQLGLLWRLSRQRLDAALVLAALYGLLSVPVTVLKTLPGFLPQINPSLGLLTPGQAQEFLQSYFFWSALLVFPAYAWLRLIAARQYARSVVAALRSGAVAIGELAPRERRWLRDLEFHASMPEPRPARSRLRRFGSALRNVGASLILAGLWFVFVAQIFIAEFLNYHPAIGWLNQPLVQLPWFRYLP